MLTLALSLWLAAVPELIRPEASLAVAFVPAKGTLSTAAVTTAFDPFAKKKGHRCKVEAFKRAEFPGLGDESLEYTAVALSADERARLARLSSAVSVVLAWPRDEAAALREVYELVRSVAQKNDAFVFDRNAASAYTAASWKARIEAGWVGPVVAGRNHFMVHLVPQETDLIMLDTGGMPRFGIDDFEVLDVNRASVRAAGDLVNVVAQRLIEGGRPDAQGRLTVRVAELKDTELREQTTQLSFPNAKGMLVVSFVPPTSSAAPARVLSSSPSPSSRARTAASASTRP